MKYIIILAAIILHITCFAQTKITSEKALKKVNKKNVQLLDVRTSEEFNKKHLKNAVNINWNDKENFDVRTNKLNKKRPVYVYCLSGGRSNKAAQYLAEQGFDVFDIEGGIMQWEASNLPIVDNENKLSGLTLKDYNSLTKSHHVVLVDFYAEWCAPCKEMAPIIDEIAKTYKDKVKVIKINTDENNALVKQLSISGIPKLYIFKNGKETWSKTGVTDLATIENELK